MVKILARCLRPWLAHDRVSHSNQWTRELPKRNPKMHSSINSKISWRISWAMRTDTVYIVVSFNGRSREIPHVWWTRSSSSIHRPPRNGAVIRTARREHVSILFSVVCLLIYIFYMKLSGISVFVSWFLSYIIFIYSRSIIYSWTNDADKTYFAFRWWWWCFSSLTSGSRGRMTRSRTVHGPSDVGRDQQEGTSTTIWREDFILRQTENSTFRALVVCQQNFFLDNEHCDECIPPLFQLLIRRWNHRSMTTTMLT